MTAKIKVSFFSSLHTVSHLTRPSISSIFIGVTLTVVHSTYIFSHRAETSRTDGRSKQFSSWEQSHKNDLLSLLSKDSARDIKCLGW